MIDKDYCINLKRKRNELKLTQQEVADKSGISRTYYTDIENGRSFPNGKVLLRINEILPIFLFNNDVKRDLKEWVR